MTIHTLDDTLFSETVAGTTYGDALELKNEDRRISNFYVQNEVTVETPAAGDFVDAVAEESTITLETQANSANGDFFTITDGDGNTYAVWLNVNGAGSAPTGEHYTGADVQIEADLSSLGDQEVSIITFDTEANSVHGDYFAVHDSAGDTFAVYLATNQYGPPSPAPSGSVYDNAEYKVGLRIWGLTTAAAIGAAATARLNALSSFSSRFTAVDNEDGSITITNTVPGAASDAEVHDEDDSGAGTITASTDTGGALGTDAADVAALVVAAIDTAMDGQVTIVDNLDGSVTFTNDYEAAAVDAAVYDTDEEGVSTITVAQDVDGVSGSSVSTDLIYVQDHGYALGLKGQLTTTDTLPTGLALLTDYFVIAVDDDHFKLADTLAHAVAGTAINITAAGAGTHTFTAASVAGANIKLQASADGVVWIDAGSSQNDDITVSANIAWNVAGLYAKYIRQAVTLTAGQLDVTSKVTG